MQRSRLIAFCVLSMLMLSVAGSGFVFSQELEDIHLNFIVGYHDEFYHSEELNQKRREYSQFANQLHFESTQTTAENATKLSTERLNAYVQRIIASGTLPTVEEQDQIIHGAYAEAKFDNEYDLHQKFAEQEKEIFPDALERQQRQFQLQESITRRLELFDDPKDMDVLLDGITFDHKLAQPDFLELAPEQKDLIKEIQKETVLKTALIGAKARSEQPDKQKEIRQLMQKLATGQTDEEPNATYRKIREIQADMLKDYIPELKAALIEGRESYMRVLTDAQKAKIKAVMDDMPDYMKNLFAAIDKQGGGLSILHNWQPGMGVPDYPNPNREAARERTNTGSGGRAFPGE